MGINTQRGLEWALCVSKVMNWIVWIKAQIVCVRDGYVRAKYQLNTESLIK